MYRITNSRWGGLWTKLVFLLAAAVPSCCVDEQLRLQPSVDMVNQSSYAVFNCSYHCTSQSPQTHTIHWLVGDAESLSERSFVNGDEQSFTDRSGLSVDVDDISICTGRAQRAIQQLRINGSSAEQHNRTAVQCVAVPTSINVKTFYSSYSLMLINNPVNVAHPTSSLHPVSKSKTGPTAVVTSAILPTPTPTPTPCPAPVTHTKVITVTREVTVTLSPTSLPVPTDVDMLCSNMQLLGSSLAKTLCSSALTNYSATWTSLLLPAFFSQIVTWMALNAL